MEKLEKQAKTCINGPFCIAMLDIFTAAAPEAHAVDAGTTNTHPDQCPYGRIWVWISRWMMVAVNTCSCMKKTHLWVP